MGGLYLDGKKKQEGYVPDHSMTVGDHVDGA